MSASPEHKVTIESAREWAQHLLVQTSDTDDDGPSLDDERSAQELEGLAHALEVARVVVERYGRVWAKNTDYYAAADLLGIEEPPS